MFPWLKACKFGIITLETIAVFQNIKPFIYKSFKVNFITSPCYFSLTEVNSYCTDEPNKYSENFNNKKYNYNQAKTFIANKFLNPIWCGGGDG